MTENKLNNYSFNRLEKEYNVIGMWGLSSHQRPQFKKNSYYYNFNNIWLEFKNLKDKNYFKKEFKKDKDNDK